MRVNKQDIIITDPCYLMRKDNKHDDWDRCDCGKNMEVLGFTNFMVSSSFQGDVSNKLFNVATKEVIGGCCCDSGQFGVFLLDEILKYNPDYDYQNQSNKNIAVYIKDFEGEVLFKKLEIEGVYIKDGTYSKKGHKYISRTLLMTGIGNINFSNDMDYPFWNYDKELYANTNFWVKDV